MNDIFRDENVKMLYLLSSFGIGKSRIWELERRFGSLDELYKAIAFERDNKLFTAEEKKSASATTAKQLYELLNYCNENGIGIVLYNDEYYPERLRAIPNPPILLFYKGERELLAEKYIVSIVGTRNPSEYSLKITEKNKLFFGKKRNTRCKRFCYRNGYYRSYGSCKSRRKNSCRAWLRYRT